MNTKAIIGIACVGLVLTIAACRSRHCHSDPSYSAPPVTTSIAPAVAVGKPPTGKPFPTPQAAMEAVGELLGKHDEARVEEVFGPGATEVLWSGDDVADKEAAMKVKALMDAGISYDRVSDDAVIAELGTEKWPLPIPLVKTPEGWRFDLEEGKEELRHRRIGRNELDTIETLYEYVEGQKEYYAKGRDGNPAAYAQKVRSTSGKHDGLYWEQKEGEEESPFGDLFAEAQKAGYGPSGSGEPRPFHGYFYKILTAQGPDAPGGKKSYVDSKGLMTKGFAAIAWPANYDNSGIKTFVVSQIGVVFEKDLGDDTERLAAAITEYNPDKSWTPSRKPKPDDVDAEK